MLTKKGNLRAEIRLSAIGGKYSADGRVQTRMFGFTPRKEITRLKSRLSAIGGKYSAVGLTRARKLDGRI